MSTTLDHSKHTPRFPNDPIGEVPYFSPIGYEMVGICPRHKQYKSGLASWDCFITVIVKGNRCPSHERVKVSLNTRRRQAFVVDVQVDRPDSQ
jgi:hypothetical protein